MDTTQVVFDSHVNGFARVEYLSVFVALLYAFAVSEFFVCWSKMLRNRASITFSIDHIIFSFIYFWILLINWYALWVQIKFLDQGFFYFVLTLIPIVITYIASVYLFPDTDKITDLKVYFDENFNVIAILTTTFMIATMAIQIGESHLDLFSPFVIYRFLNAILIIVIVAFNLKKLRRLVLVTFTLGLLFGSYALAFI